MKERTHCIVCRGVAHLKSGTVGHSHGGDPLTYWLECDCGLRTKGITQGYEGTKEECIEKVFKIWNRGGEI